MSDRLVGEIDGYPWLTVNVETGAGLREIKFLLDTGFDGEVALPQSYASWFGISGDFFEAEFADGVHESSMIVPCRVEWLDGFRDVTAMYIKGRNPLLGMELVDDCRVTLEIESRHGEVLIEPNS